MLEEVTTGDLHNFGRQVQFVQQDEMDLVFKPRTVFWEHLFFGAESPLRDIFAHSSIKFQIKVCQPEGDFSNHVLKISHASPKSDRTSALFRPFGELLGYCYHFGIQDLHWQNILSVENGLQVVDVEQVFSDLLLPNQTLMLPSEDLLKNSAAINLLTTRALEELNSTEADELVSGFNQISSLILKNFELVLAKLGKFEQRIHSTPNRVFFRRTKDYVEYLQGNKLIENLFESEKIQLLRGDVPYFFMLVGGSEVFAYVDSEWHAEAVEIPESFLKYSSYASFSPKELLQAKIIEAKWARGTLYLAHKLKSLDVNLVRGDIFSLSEDQGQLCFHGPTQNYTTSAKW